MDEPNFPGGSSHDNEEDSSDAECRKLCRAIQRCISLADDTDSISSLSSDDQQHVAQARAVTPSMPEPSVEQTNETATAAQDALEPNAPNAFNTTATQEMPNFDYLFNGGHMHNNFAMPDNVHETIYANYVNNNPGMRNPHIGSHSPSSTAYTSSLQTLNQLLWRQTILAGQYHEAVMQARYMMFGTCTPAPSRIPHINVNIANMRMYNPQRFVDQGHGPYFPRYVSPGRHVYSSPNYRTHPTPFMERNILRGVTPATRRLETQTGLNATRSNAPLANVEGFNALDSNIMGLNAPNSSFNYDNYDFLQGLNKAVNAIVGTSTSTTDTSADLALNAAISLEYTSETIPSNEAGSSFSFTHTSSDYNMTSGEHMTSNSSNQHIFIKSECDNSSAIQNSDQSTSLSAVMPSSSQSNTNNNNTDSITTFDYSNLEDWPPISPRNRITQRSYKNSSDAKQNTSSTDSLKQATAAITNTKQRVGNSTGIDMEPINTRQSSHSTVWHNRLGSTYTDTNGYNAQNWTSESPEALELIERVAKTATIWSTELPSTSAEALSRSQSIKNSAESVIFSPELGTGASSFEDSEISQYNALIVNTNNIDAPVSCLTVDSDVIVQHISPHCLKIGNEYYNFGGDLPATEDGVATRSECNESVPIGDALMLNYANTYAQAARSALSIAAEAFAPSGVTTKSTTSRVKTEILFSRNALKSTNKTKHMNKYVNKYSRGANLNVVSTAMIKHPAQSTLTTPTAMEANQKKCTKTGAQAAGMNENKRQSNSATCGKNKKSCFNCSNILTKLSKTKANTRKSIVANGGSGDTAAVSATTNVVNNVSAKPKKQSTDYAKKEEAGDRQISVLNARKTESSSVGAHGNGQEQTHQKNQNNRTRQKQKKQH